jgi:outer membrane beta-barrel protein
VGHKLYPLTLNPEFSLMWDSSLADRYTSHMGPRVSAMFHVLDFLALELHGGYMFGSESSIMRTLRDKSKPTRQTRGDREPALPGLQQLTYHFGGDVQLAPLYGKLSFVSEFETAFRLYGLAGVGVAGTRTVTDATRSGTCPPGLTAGGFGGCAQFMAGPVKLLGISGLAPQNNDILGPGEYQVLPLAVPVEYGLGLHVQGMPPPPPYMPALPPEIGRWFAFRAEIRNHHWLGINNQMNLNVREDADDESGCEQGYRLENDMLDRVYGTLTSGGRPCYLNIHTVTLARFGVSFLIPVNSFF